MRQGETYAEWTARLEPLTARIDAIAYRLRQGAIGLDVAAERLRDLADEIERL